MKLPAISVIIPMYNTEKYIGECLDSLLAQSFQDFEVIVVDDCSTDSSFAIVQSYLPKFDGRLRLIKLKTNSGGASAPRNRGIKFASGEYLFFMDSDDTLISTAFEEFYKVAKNFEVDVVHCEKYYHAPNNSAPTDKNLLSLSSRNKIDVIEIPTLDTTSLPERVQKLIQNRFWWAPWSHFIKREFMLDNDIDFPKLNIADDLIFSIFLYCSAEKVVTMPEAFYVWRTLADSNSRADFTHIQVEKFIHRRVNDIFLGIQILDKFTKRFELFEKELPYKYALIDFFVVNQTYNMRNLYQKFPAIMFDKLIREEFVAIGNDPIVAAFLFDKMMTWEVTFVLNQQEQMKKINRFTMQAQQRITELENEIKQLKGKV